MLPQKQPSAFQPLYTVNSFVSIPTTQIQEANKDLRNAVEYATIHEMTMLVDRAISKGAKINNYASYENHLMVVAVRSRQPHAISILMARGLQVPFVQENGIDILMEATAAGYDDLIDPLIKLAGMCVFSADADGKTALHHAVIGGSANSVKILLQYGADPNALTKKMDDAELCSIFGDNHGLAGTNITPLMIASATGQHKITALLLEEKADLTAGESNPLILACKNSHTAVVKLLLSQQTHPKFSNEGENAILSMVIENGASIECLRLIAPYHCFDTDDGTINSTLGLAIKSKQASTVALLLAYEAPIKKFNAEDNTLWDEAFAKETKPWELLDLLVTSSSLENISSSDYSKENFLSIFFDHCDNPIPLAAIGFYPSIVESSREILYRIKSIDSSLTKMEKQLLTAHILSTNLAKLHTNSNLISNENESKEPDSQWIKKTQLNRIQQKSSLQEETSHFISNQLNKLRYALSLDFFLECADACPENRSLKNFIVNKLATEIGTPSEISEAIASIWTQAAQWATNWHVATHSIEEANRFLIHLTRNLLHKKFSNYIADENDLYHQCHDAICDELSITIDPLNNFCSNPVAWLRKYENRSNLRPVDESDLANSLQIELGLPIVTCQAISNAWSKAINLAKKSPQWKKPHPKVYCLQH